MQDHRRLRSYQSTTTEELIGGSLVDFTILADDGVHGLGEVDGSLLTFGIENDDNVTPVIAACIVLQTEGHHTLRRLEKLQMLPDQMGITQPEGRMVLTEGDKILIILENLRITLEIRPIKLVDTIW